MKSEIPFINGISGPIRTISIECVIIDFLTEIKSLISTSIQKDIFEIPTLGLVTKILISCFELNIFQAKECSRAPDPIISKFI